jgi:hypothetical protein
MAVTQAMLATGAANCSGQFATRCGAKVAFGAAANVEAMPKRPLSARAADRASTKAMPQGSAHIEAES